MNVKTTVSLEESRSKGPLWCHISADVIRENGRFYVSDLESELPLSPQEQDDAEGRLVDHARCYG